jgi:hypothetical protein
VDDNAQGNAGGFICVFLEVLKKSSPLALNPEADARINPQLWLDRDRSESAESTQSVEVPAAVTTSL